MIRIRDLVYTAGQFRLEVSLDIHKGEYFVIMGVSGSGKTALVECLAGLRLHSGGVIEIFGRDATGLEPRRRMVGYVPQDYALFTNRTVRGNIAFGPEVRGWTSQETERAVLETARLVGVEALLDRRIAGLSGGERQRVALARAVVTRPEVLILDEPVSALDESTREVVCSELRRLQRELGITTIHITHNLEEAFSIADRAAVMRGGRIEQVGKMEALLRQPASRTVAGFMRCENIFEGETVGEGGVAGTTRVRVDGGELVLPGRHLGRVVFVVRPESVRVQCNRVLDDKEPSDAVWPARLIRAVDRGVYTRLELESCRRLVAHMPTDGFRRLGVRDGDSVAVFLGSQDLHVIRAS